ncbi:hypothetical protein DEU56DRAFT_760398 [Suillus clintonianus]|uniref:uncharacterized protein n=1 Tax=Suillus clintonianus TaxID=1904413 RepID=UPI001B85D10C|nr:uncharacterized protein DEU56DRAFT_760398 [Suillus clintonianus]KAG2122215.1 hypothetical protein DEU56DRAFT_760398 [Suillus clintonianus]
MPRLTEFQHLPIPTPKTFNVNLLEGWLQRWPEQDVLWPDQEAEVKLTEDQKKELCLAEKDREYLASVGVASPKARPFDVWLFRLLRDSGRTLRQVPKWPAIFMVVNIIFAHVHKGESSSM